MNLKDYQTFFEGLAKRHVEIRHTENGKIRFCTFEPDEITNLARFKLDMGNFCLALKKFEIKTGTNQSGQARKYYNCGFVIFKSASAQSSDAEKTAIQDDAESICNDIWLELQYQQYEGLGWLKIGGKKMQLEIGSYDAAPISGISNNGVGFDVFLSFSEFTDHTRRNPARFLPG